MVAHLSPIPSDPEAGITLKAGDVVKISLGAHIDGFAGILADTLVIPEIEGEDVITGRKADVLMAAWLASEVAIRVVKPGKKNYDVTEAVAKVAEAFGCKPLEGNNQPCQRSLYRYAITSTISQRCHWEEDNYSESYFGAKEWN